MIFFETRTADLVVDNVELRQAMMADIDELTVRLTAGLALQQDRPLQAALRRAAGVAAGRPVAVRMPESEAWLVLGEAGSHPVASRSPGQAAPVDFPLDDDRHAWPMKALLAATQRTKADVQALDLLDATLDIDIPPSQAQMRALLAWAPLLEPAAQRLAAHSTKLLDQLRPPLLWTLDAPSTERDARLLEYWNRAHTLGHMTLLASALQTRAWIGAPADRLWAKGTPTVGLLRERTLWLAAIAAQAAVALGEWAIERYMARVLAPGHPMARFDAVFSLLAIGLGLPSLRTAILKDLKSAITVVPPALEAERDLPLIEAAAAVLADPNRYHQAAVAAGVFGGVGLPRTPGLGLFGPGMGQDPYAWVEGLGPIGFVALPMLTSLAPEKLYPSLPGRTARLSATPAAIARLLARAWAPNIPTPPTPTAH